MMLLGLTFFSNQYISKSYRNHLFSIRLLEKYTQREFYAQSPFKPYLQMVQQQISQLEAEQLLIKSALNRFGLIITILIITQLVALFYLTFNYKPSAYDGILVSLFPLIFATFILMILSYLNHHFMEGERANDQLIKSIYYLLFVASPIFSYAGFRLNSKEIKLHLHQQKWMGYLCKGLLIISMVVVIISMFGILLVPDISNFKN